MSKKTDISVEACNRRIAASYINYKRNYVTYIESRNRKEYAEPKIAMFPELSYEYALLLNKRFITGEPALAEHMYYAYHYAKNILQGRFPLAEKKCLQYWMTKKTRPRQFKMYIDDILDGDYGLLSPCRHYMMLVV